MSDCPFRNSEANTRPEPHAHIRRLFQTRKCEQPLAHSDSARERPAATNASVRSMLLSDFFCHFLPVASSCGNGIAGRPMTGRARLRGREELAARVQQALALADQERSRARRKHGYRELGDHSAQSSGRGRIHAEAQHLRQVLRALQAGDSPEDWVHWTGHPDKDAAEGQIHQFGCA
jgi:hypothetical protein